MSFVVIVFWWQVFAILQFLFEKKPWKNMGSQCEKTHMVPHFTESCSLCFCMNLLPLLHLVQIVSVVPNHNVCIKGFAIETRVIDAENLGFSVTFLVQLEVQ
jgi:hypothetical protein